MQSVVRYTFVGLLAVAGLTACGDKVTVPPPTQAATDTTVSGVTVTPATASLNVGDKVTFGVSVTAGAEATNRTVTWKSSDATIVSVDGNGNAQALKVGTASITATSVANPNASGSAIVTVGGGGVQNATVTISQVLQNLPTGDVNANLNNVFGQLDVVVNVDPGSATLAGVDLHLICGTKDTVVASQNLSASATSSVAAEASTAPVTMSFNTAAFNSTTGAPAFVNGACSLEAVARLAGSSTQAASSSQAITLANNDIVVGTIATTNYATDASGRPWFGGSAVTVSALPVMYSGRTPITATIGLALAAQGPNTPAGALTTGSAVLPNAQTVQAVAGGATTVTFANSGPAGTGVANVAGTNIVPTIQLTDNQGNTIGGAGGGFASITAKATNPATTFAAGGGLVGGINLDNQKPAAGTFSVTNNPDQGVIGTGFVGANFRFAGDSAAGYRGPDAVAGNQTRNLDNGGVDRVTVTFQAQTPIGGTFNTVTAANALAQTTVSTADSLRMVVTDALGNATTVGIGHFGVDLSPPVLSVAGASANSTCNAAEPCSTPYTVTMSDSLSGPNTEQLVAQTRQWNGFTTSGSEGKTQTNVGLGGNVVSTGSLPNDPCVIGRFNASSSNAGANALPVFNTTGAQVGYCTPVLYTLGNGGAVTPDALATAGPGYFTTEIIALDQAGNQTSAFTRTVLEDNTAPTVANIDLPATITGNSTATFPSAVTDQAAAGVGDITSSYAQLKYSTVTVNAVPLVLQYPTTTGPGTSFDNVLTQSASVAPTIPNFAKSIRVSTATQGNANGAVSAAANNADGIAVFATDAANNTGSLSTTLSPPVQFNNGTSAGTTFDNTTFTAGFRDSTSKTTVQDCTSSCASGTASATSATLMAIAQGTATTFNDPFSGGAVSFWYQVVGDPNQQWFYIGNAGAGAAMDTGVGNGRSWTYSLSWTPPKTAPDGFQLSAPANANGAQVNIRAIGVNTNGDAVMTGGGTQIQLKNP